MSADGPEPEDLDDDGIARNDCPTCGAPLIPEPILSGASIRLVSRCAEHGVMDILDPFEGE